MTKPAYKLISLKTASAMAGVGARAVLTAMRARGMAFTEINGKFFLNQRDVEAWVAGRKTA